MTKSDQCISWSDRHIYCNACGKRLRPNEIRKKTIGRRLCTACKFKKSQPYVNRAADGKQRELCESLERASKSRTRMLVSFIMKDSLFSASYVDFTTLVDSRRQWIGVTFVRRLAQQTRFFIANAALSTVTIVKQFLISRGLQAENNFQPPPTGEQHIPSHQDFAPSYAHPCRENEDLEGSKMSAGVLIDENLPCMREDDVSEFQNGESHTPLRSHFVPIHAHSCEEYEELQDAKMSAGILSDEILPLERDEDVAEVQKALLNMSFDDEVQIGRIHPKTSISSSDLLFLNAEEAMETDEMDDTSPTEIVQGTNDEAAHHQDDSLLPLALFSAPADGREDIEIPIQSCGYTTSFICSICGANQRKQKRVRLQRVPLESRLEVFRIHGVFMNAQARCCIKHTDDKGLLKSEDLKTLQNLCTSTRLTSRDIKDLLTYLRGKSNTHPGLDFDTPFVLNDEDYRRLTGIGLKDFDKLLTIVDGRMRNTYGRSTRACLALLLMKLRLGLSNGVLASLFGLQDKSRVSRTIKSVRTILMDWFVPLHVGLHHISRDEVISNHTTDTAKILFGSKDNVCILVADGTYIYIQKSGNYYFQRRSFSLHKGRNLLKPMILTSTTGYIVDIFGPYFADFKNNDANIIKDILAKDSVHLRNWLHPDDVLVVDRGFRDSIGLMTDMGIVPKMPHFLGKRKQHTCEEANESRLVTKIRWVVEAVNGLIKQWTLLEKTFPNSQIPFVGDYVRIVAALCNAFRPPRIQSTPEDNDIARNMLRRSKETNRLQERVLAHGWSRKTVNWTAVTAESSNVLEDFPRFSVDDLRSLTLGVYQLKEARSYTEEHLSDTGEYELQVFREEPTIIRAKLQSRHVSSVKRMLWIEYTPNEKAVLGYFCQCPNGARTVGCCAHIASVIWYLSYWRHEERAEKSPRQVYAHYIDDAAKVVKVFGDPENDTADDWSEED